MKKLRKFLWQIIFFSLNVSGSLPDIEGRKIRPSTQDLIRFLFGRWTVGARLRTGAAVLEVVDSVGDIQTIVITTGVNIAAVMPSGARGAIRIALGLRAAVFEEIDSVLMLALAL
jgi:hypothetical protein